VSALGEALKGIKELLLLQAQVQNLERAVENQSDAMKQLGRDLIDVDRRVTRIEGVMEGVARASPTPRRPRLSRK
jgi:hypothetical protein